PIYFIHDKHLLDRGLRNYWGYNSIGYFAPDTRYGRARTAGAQVNEFKTMVKTLHNAGIEVILDVVYNHTAEGNHPGPTLSFRGIDHASYYRLVPGNERGYQVGNFPVLWTEWNGKYRDAVRRFWRGDSATVAELGYRLTGSSDLYALNGRRPYASINFVTAHDGFTMRDLVSYNQKHNEANGEGNRDGESHNLSWNCGD